MDIFLIGFVIYGLIFGFACRYIAAEKGKDPGTWFIIGFLLGLLGLLIVGFSKSELKETIRASNLYSGGITTEAEATKSVSDEVRIVDIYCPIEVADMNININETTGVPFCNIKFSNLSNKTVSAIDISIVCYDSFMSPVGKTPKNQFDTIIQDESAEPGTFFGYEKQISLSDHPATRKVDVIVRKILFQDGSVWEKGAYELTKVTTTKPSGQELKNLKTIAGDDAICYAKESGEIWTCVCGRINSQTHTFCIRCRRNKELVTRDFSNIFAIDREIDKRIAAERERQLDLQTKQSAKNLAIRKWIKKAIPASVVIALVLITFVITGGKFTYQGYELKQLNKKDSKGYNALMYAVEANDLNRVKELIDKGVDIGVQDNEGWTPMTIALKNNSIDIFNILADSGFGTKETDNLSLKLLHEFDGRNNSIAFSPDSSLLALGYDDNTVRIREVGTGNEVQILGEKLGSLYLIYSIAFSPDGHLVACGDTINYFNKDPRNTTFRVWDLKTGNMKLSFPADSELSGWTVVAFSHDSRYIAVATKTGIRLWEVATGLQVKYFEATDAFGIAFNSSGKLMASTHEGKVILWDVDSTEQLATIQLTGQGGKVFFSKDDKKLAFTENNVIRVYDVDNKKTIYNFVDHTGNVAALAFNRDGGILVSASWDKTVKLWDLETGKIIKNIPIPPNVMNSMGFFNPVAISPNLHIVAGGNFSTKIFGY